MSFNKEIYKKILTEKRIKNLHVAKATNIPRSRLSLCVNGWEKFKEEDKDKLCKFLGITKKELFKDD